MARFTFNSIFSWLQTAELDKETWEQLMDLASRKANEAQRAEAKYHEALAEAAAKVGVSVAELIAKVQHQSNVKYVSGTRKPYLNCLEDDGKIYSISKNRPKPEWLERAEAQGWTLAECHYQRLAAAWASRGWMPLYPDPVARHAELVDKEPVKLSRSK